MKNKPVIAIIVLLFVAMGVAYFVSRQQTHEAFVAEVNGARISVNDFRMNYEFGWGHLKTAADARTRKREYLDMMIAEKLFASEGYKFGFDRNDRVKALEQDLRNELLIEKLIATDVKPGIQISKAEVEEEIAKSKVSFKFRFWAEYSRERADALAALMRQRGFLQVLDEMNSLSAETRIDVASHETDYVTYLEIAPEFLHALQNLPIGEISQPVLVDSKYFILQVVDIRRTALTTNDYAAQFGSFQKVLFHARLRDSLTAYLDRLLTPMKFTTKGRTVKLIAAAVAEWYAEKGQFRSRFSDVVDHPLPHQKGLQELQRRLNSAAVTYRDGNISLKDLVSFLKVNDLEIDTNNTAKLEGDVNTRIALSLRDRFLVEQARERGYERDDSLQRELEQWREKWVCEEYIDYVTRGLHSAAKPTAQARREYFTTVNDRAKELLKSASVSINHDVLDTILTFDLAKSRLATFQIFRGGSNRPAVPLVDPIWHM